MKKILLADDSITIQKVVELTFSEGDYQVVCVSNGAQALRKVSEFQPDLVLLDVIMPEKNGYEVCEALKRNPTTSGIPVLLLTGTFEPFDKKRAETIGADGHLTKPFESHALVSKVDELIAARPKLVPAERAGAMDIIAGGEVRHLDAAGGVGLSPAPSPQAFPAPPPPPVPSWDAAPEEPAAPQPAHRVPDPAAGGSYVGFADLDAGALSEGEMVPDRYDSVSPPPTATVRMSREELFAAPGGSPAASLRPPDEGSFASPMEGFTSGYDLPPSAPPRGPADHHAAAEASPPAEAGPAPGSDDAWRPAESVPDVPESASPRPQPAATEAAAAPLPGTAVPPGPLNLAPETIERIADEVLRRMSDRVVREIAWEVIPQVAESLVTRRIKELEEGGGS